MAAVVVAKGAPVRLTPPAIKSVDWRSGMGMVVQELYTPVPLGVNSSTTLTTGDSGWGGFLCTTAGNFSLQDASGNTIIAAIGVVVGQFVVGGFACLNGIKVVLSGGCAGTASYSSSWE